MVVCGYHVRMDLCNRRALPGGRRREALMPLLLLIILLHFVFYRVSEPPTTRRRNYITQADFQGSRFSPGGTVSPVCAVGSINATCCTFSVASFFTAASSASRACGVISN